MFHYEFDFVNRFPLSIERFQFRFWLDVDRWLDLRIVDRRTGMLWRILRSDQEFSFESIRRVIERRDLRRTDISENNRENIQMKNRKENKNYVDYIVKIGLGNVRLKTSSSFGSSYRLFRFESSKCRISHIGNFRCSNRFRCLLIT